MILYGHKHVDEVTAWPLHLWVALYFITLLCIDGLLAWLRKYCYFVSSWQHLWISWMDVESWH